MNITVTVIWVTRPTVFFCYEKRPTKIIEPTLTPPADPPKKKIAFLPLMGSHLSLLNHLKAFLERKQ